MGDAAKTTPCDPSASTHNAIHCLVIIHIIPSRQIYVAIDKPSLVPSISCHSDSNYSLNYVLAADDLCDAENL